MSEFLQTYGSWIVLGVLFVLMMRMHQGMAPPTDQGLELPAREKPGGTPPVGQHPIGFRPNWAFLLISLGIWAAFIFAMAQPKPGATHDEVALSQVAADVRAGLVRKIAVDGDTLTITRIDGTEQHARKEPLVSAAASLKELGVEPAALSGLAIEVKAPSAWGGVVGLLITLLPMALFIGFFVWMGRKGQPGMGQALSFAKSRAKPVIEKPSVTFADVAGVDEAKQELQEVVEFLKDPRRFQALGARIPKGVLLVGPPGTGKTLLARATAGEAGVAFFHLSGSEFVEMFVGVGAARVRDLFDQAKKAAPCIVFVDELDAVGRHRGAGLGGGNDEREQTLNQILVEMDGFEPTMEVIVLAATNRPDVLDPALLRPGRFDRRVMVELPDLAGRVAILSVHARGKPFAPQVNLGTVARQTPGFSGADLANLVNEAALLAARGGAQQIAMRDLEAAAERVTLGPERRGRVLSARDKAVTAFHEAGHAVVGDVPRPLVGQLPLATAALARE